MSDQKDIYNQVLARLVHKQRLASRDQIRFCLSQVTPNKDLGQVMIEHALLDFEQYLKFHNYIHKLFSAPGGKDKIREILGQGGSGRESQGRVAPRPAAPAPRPAMDSSQSFPTVPNTQSEASTPQPAVPTHQPTPQHAVQNQGPAPQQQAPIVVAQDEEVLPAEYRGSSGDGHPRENIPHQLNAGCSLNEILLFTRKHRASDLHLSPGSPIILRRFSRLKPVSSEPLTAQQIRDIITRGLSQEELAPFLACGDLEIAYTIPGGGRYRMTLCKQRFGWELTARVIPNKIRPFTESGLPPNCEELTKWAQGMVLITGPMGCGKSSTLTTMVELINNDRADHIISIEQPVEFVYEPKRCQITQREIGLHTLSQANALRAALRQDPDIIVISELRDLDSIALAVSAAETGHLVLATMNTANAQRTVNRIIDAFPPDEQDVVRNMISETLRGVISQQLVPLKDGNGLAPAFEVLIVTKAIANLIRKNNLHQLPSAMVTGRGLGMQLLDESLKKLVAEGLIEGEEAFFRASDPRVFKQYAPGPLKGVYSA